MSELLQMNLFQFIIAGHLLQMAALKMSGKESLLSKIQAVIKVNDSSLTVCSAIVEEIKKDKEDEEANEHVRSNENDNDVL